MEKNKPNLVVVVEPVTVAGQRVGKMTLRCGNVQSEDDNPVWQNWWKGVLHRSAAVAQGRNRTPEKVA